jgi:hypothetical protein
VNEQFGLKRRRGAKTHIKADFHGLGHIILRGGGVNILYPRLGRHADPDCTADFSSIEAKHL